MAYIYKIINQINGKIYIGETTRSIEERWREHQKDFSRRDFENRPLYRAFKKYGLENFSIEQIEECPADIVAERERFWIEMFGSFKNGYNATLGGDGKPYIDYDLIYAVYRECKSFSQTAKITGHDRQVISRAINSKGLPVYSKNAALFRPVAQLDKNTGEIIRVFPSVSEAERATGDSHHIGQVCSGKRKTAQGFRWKYLAD